MTWISRVLKIFGQEHALVLEKKYKEIVKDLNHTINEKEIRIQTLEEMVMEREKAHMETIQEIKLELQAIRIQLNETNRKYDENLLELQFSRAESKDWRERLEIIMTENPHIKLSEIEKKRKNRGIPKQK